MAERGAGEIADPFPPRHPPQPWHLLLQVCPLGTQPAWPRARQESGALTHNALGWLLRGSEPPLSWAHFPKSLQPAHYWRLITHLRRQASAQHGQGQLVQRIRRSASHSQPLLQHLGFPAGAQSPEPQLGEDPHPPRQRPEPPSTWHSPPGPTPLPLPSAAPHGTNGRPLAWSQAELSAGRTPCSAFSGLCLPGHAL